MNGRRTQALLATALAGAMVFGSLVGCGAQQAPQQDAASEAEQATEETEQVEEPDFNMKGGTPWICSIMKGNVSADDETSPTEDFYLHVNKDWLVKADIPKGHSANTSFYDVEEKVAANTKAVLAGEEPKGHDAKLSKQLYNAFLDWDTRNEQGVAPAQKVVDDIKSIKTLDELSAFICDPERSRDVPMLFMMGSSPMGSDASQYGTFIGTDSLLLGDSGQYRDGVDTESDDYKNTCTVVTSFLTRLGYTEDEAKAVFEDAISIETELSHVVFSTAELTDPRSLEGYHEIDYTPEELKGVMKSYPLLEYAESHGFGATKMYNVGRDDQLPLLDKLWCDENVEKIKNLFIARYAMNVVDWLDSESYEMYENTMTDPKERTGLEDEAYTIVKQILPGPLAQAYLEVYDYTETKERVTAVCEDAIQTYKELFARQEWLSDATKESFIKKLDKMKIHAVYPDKWEDFSGLDLEGLSYYECRSAIEHYKQQQSAALAGKKVDEELWKSEDILVDNAAYDGQSNSINIFLGILEGNFYQPDMTDEEMYAGIGTVIFHEISHGFDPRGVLFDADGNLHDPLWTEEEQAEYNRRAEKLVDYMNNIVVCEGKNANGALNEGETIADISGVECCLLAAQDIEGFDYEKFFTTYGALWREVGKPDKELEWVDDDVHAPAYLRVNVIVQQFDEFNETFGVKEGDTMYLAPEDRILIWD